MKKIAKYSVSLKAFIKNNKWETLILRTWNDSSFYWKYDFPWGRIDEDEFDVKLEDILKREINEELWNVKVNLWKNPVANSRNFASKEFTYTWNDEYVFYNFWEWDLISWDIEISHEHFWYKWVKLEEIVLEDYFSSWMLEWVKMYLNK